MKAVALVELVLLFEESIGVGWCRRLMLLDAVVLVEPVCLLERRATVLVGGGGALLVDAVALVERVCLLERRASVLVDDGDCCW